MPDDKKNKGCIKVRSILSSLLFLSHQHDTHAQPKHTSSPAEDIKTRILLKIERAEIMAAMLSTRYNSESQEDDKK